jgi:hypothetical protein
VPKVPILLAFLLFAVNVQAQQDSITVHFIYGSKPAKAFKGTEKKWFGGKLGGHTGIACNNDSVLHFLLKGKVHIFPRPQKKHSQFLYNSVNDFYMYLAKAPDSFKTIAITIPITMQQKIIYDSLKNNFTTCAPYDYAFFGMRCGAATYDMLAALNILKRHNKAFTIFKIFYPRKLRKRLLHLAAKNKWRISKTIGTTKRKWEND